MSTLQLLKREAIKTPSILQNPLQEIIGEGIPTCGGDLKSPVVDTVGFVDQHRYSVGGRTYIENADGGGMPE